MQEEDEDICYICYDANNEDSIKLKCNHKFHYDCILNSYIKNPKICPYCRQINGYIPLKKNIKPIKNIHKEFNTNINNPYVKICKGVFKNGNSCYYKAQKYSDYCGKHKPTY